jgi:uncharacterized membrane protein (DUF485 family)
VSKKIYIFIPAFLASIFAISIYIPYVLMTDYAKGYPQVVQDIELVGIAAILIFTVITLLYPRFSLKK